MDSKALVDAIVKKNRGSDASDEDDGDSDSPPEGAIAAAEDIMDVLSSYSGSPPSDSDSKVEKATKEAARRAKAKILAAALKAFLDCC